MKKQIESSLASHESAKANEKSSIVMVDSAMAQEASAYAQIDVAYAQYKTALAQLSQSQAQLREAELSIQIAQDDLNVARLNYKAAQDKEKQAEFNMASSAAALLSAEADLSDTTILAPFDGVILTKITEEGEVLSAGSVLFTMVDPNALYMKAYAANEDVGKLKLGDTAKVSLDAYGGEVFEGTITEINEQAEFTPKNVETKKTESKTCFRI